MKKTLGYEDPHPSIDYHIVSQISADASGLLYRAIREDDGSEVDVLVLRRTDDSEKQRIKKRIYVAIQLDHPAAAWIIDSSRDGDHPSYLLEPVAARSLSDVTAEISGKDKRRVLSYCQQLTSVVAAAHRLGLVHGNISPETVYVRSDGSLQIDFIRSRSAGELVTRRFDGPHDKTKILCRAPEALDRSDGDTASDVFSVAATLVWLFTGREGDPVPELPSLRENLGKWFGDWQVPGAYLDLFCESLSDSLKPDPWDRPSSQDICTQLERLIDTITDDAETTAQLGQTSDELARTNDFESAPDA